MVRRDGVPGGVARLEPARPAGADRDSGGHRALCRAGDADRRRLAAIKAVYDPENVFHRNANIRPAARG
ncbi:MAG TPA: BBE domain-containing protein [Pseudonocardiaceae bacterium]|nr:BBE domain-containing protein [Pseudonocardiaceae bacterium]